MAVTQAQKVDFLLKKIGFTKTKTGLAVDETLSGTKKAGFAEAIPSPLIIANDSLWNESSLIPATPPGSDTSQVKVYLASSSGHQMTVDSTVAGNRAFIAFSTYNNTSSARLNNWIDTQFGSSYLIKVFRGDPNSGGVQLSAAGSGNNDGWFFDYSAGVLNFNDTNVPSGVTSSNIYIVGYRYIGLTGAPTPTGAGNFTFNDVTVTGDLDVDGHTNLDNVSIAGVTTATTLQVTGDTFLNGNVDLGNTGSDPITASGRFDSDLLPYTDNFHSYRIGNSSYRWHTANFGTGGISVDSGINVVGVGTFAGAIDANGDLDVDGHTNLDNVSIAGVSTFAGNATFNGNVNTVHNLLQVDGNTTLGVSASDNIDPRGSFVRDLIPGATVTHDIGSSTYKWKILHTNHVNAVGVGTFGDIDVDGHTNLDNVSVAGVTTFSNTVHVGAGITIESNGQATFAGITTFRDGVRLPNFYPGSIVGKIQIGDSNGYEIFHYNNNNYLTFTRDLFIRGDNIGRQIKLQPKISQNGILVIPDGAVELYHSGTKRLETSSVGVSIPQDLDVDGHTNLDNVSVAGVTTFSGGSVIINPTGANHSTFTINSNESNDTPGPIINLSRNNGFFSSTEPLGEIRFVANSNKNYGKITGRTTNTGSGTEDGKIQVSAIKNGTETVVTEFTHNGVDIPFDLDVDGHTNLDNVSIAGVVTATTFTGALSGNASSATQLQTARNIGGVSFDGTSDIDLPGVNIAGNQDTSGTAAGLSGSPSINITNLTAVDGTFSGNVSIGGTLTYEDVTNIDSVGLVTARSGIFLPDTQKAQFGNVAGSADLEIYHTGNTSTIKHNNGSGDLIIDALATGSDIRLRSEAEFQVQVGGNTHIQVYKNGGVSFFQAGTGAGKKLETLSTGARVTGTLDVTSGITVAGNIDANGDLDVDGHTNLDNVSVAGVTTFASNIDVDGHTTLNSLRVSGITTLADNIFLGHGGDDDQINISAKFISGFQPLNNLIYDIGDNVKRWKRVYAGTFIGGGVNVGVVTATGADINGDLDVDGHTNLDNVSVAGVSTFSGNINLPDSVSAIFGTDDDGSIKHTGTNLQIFETTGNIQITNYANDKDVVISSDDGSGGTTPYFLADGSTGKVELYHYGTKRLETTGIGIAVNGKTDTTLLDVNERANIFDMEVSGISTFAGGVDVNSDLDVDGHTNLDNVSVAGVTTFSGVIEGIAGENKIPFLYSNQAALPDAGTYHGMFAHVHATGRGYFAHAGNWLELVNKETNGTVGTGTETYNIGSLTATGIDLNGDLDVDGHTNLDNVSVAGVTTFSGGDVDFTGDNFNIKFDKSASSLKFLDNGTNAGAKAAFGTGNDLQIFHHQGANYIKVVNTQSLVFGTDNTNRAMFESGGHFRPIVDSTYDLGINATRWRNVYADTYYGDGSNLTGISVDATALKDPNGNVKIQAQASGAVHVGIATFQDIDVDGHTNLDNVSIAGVTTITSNVLYLKSASGSGPTISAITGSDVLNLASNGLIVKNQNGWKGLEFTGSSIELYSGQMASHKLVLQTNSSGVALPLDLDVDGHTNLDNVSVAGVSTFSANIDVISTDTGNSAAPELKLFRNSSSPANADYLGEIKFAGKSNAGTERNYAKITGKILDVTNAGEDGILEFSHIKNGSETITGRWRSDSLQLLNSTNFSVAGNSIFNGDAEFSSTITAGGATGSNGQYLKSTGSGVAWESFPTMRTTTTITASAGQTTFSFSYNIGFLDVFVNGTKLTDSEFTATNGTSVVLAVGCFVGDIVELVSYNTVSGGGGAGGSITVQDEGSSLSTDATVLNFVGTGVVASGTGATKTITINAGAGDTSNVTTNNLNVVGFSTFARTLLMSGQQRINFGSANTAIYHNGNFRIESSGSGGDIILKTNASGGDSKDVVLHGGTVGELLRAHGTGDVDITNTLGIGGSITKASGQLDIRADNLQLKNAASGATYASFTNGGAAELNHNNTKRLETTSNGVNVIGSLFVNGSAIGGGGGGSGFFSQTVAGIHTLSNVGIGTADPEFDLDLGSYISSGVSVASTIRIIGENNSTAIRIGPGGTNNDITIIRVDSKDGTTDGDTFTDLGHSIKYMGSGSGVENRLAFWVDNTNKTKYEALSIYNNGFIGINYSLGFNGVPPTDHFTVENGTSKFDAVRVVGVSTFQNVLPQTDSTYDIGTNTVRFRNIYADTLYGDGSNLTGISGGGGADVGITTNLSGSFSATPGSPTTINTLSGYSSDDLVVEYTIYIKNGSNIQTQKLLAMRNGTTIDSTQFAVMFSSSLLAQFDTTISSGNILLRATPESGITGTTDYKIKREVM